MSLYPVSTYCTILIITLIKEIIVIIQFAIFLIQLCWVLSMNIFLEAFLQNHSNYWLFYTGSEYRITESKSEACAHTIFTLCTYGKHDWNWQGFILNFSRTRTLHGHALRKLRLCDWPVKKTSAAWAWHGRRDCVFKKDPNSFIITFRKK